MQGKHRFSHKEEDFFKDLAKEKDFFMSKAKRRPLSKGSIIFFENDSSEFCYYLEHGIIRIFKISPTGKEPIYFIRKQGDIFGIAELINSHPRKSNAQTLTECTIWELNKTDFETMIERYPNFSKNIINTLGNRIRYLGDQVESLMVCDVVTRMAKLIVYLAYENISFENEWEQPVTIKKSLTQEQMASMTGSCQQTVSEILKGFQEEGLIEANRGNITVLNPLKLIRKAEH